MAKSIKPMWAVYGPGGWIAPFDDFSDAEKEARDEARRNVGSNFVVFGAVAAFVADPPVVRTVVLQGSDAPAPSPEPEDIIDYMEAKAAASARGHTAKHAALREGPGKSPLANGAPSLVNAGLPPLTLREGAFYMRRDCVVVAPLRRNDTSGEGGWIAGGALYLNCGRFSTNTDRHTYDLIAECDPEGWIEWAGGECPVRADTQVEIKIFGGEHFPAGPADCFDWGSGKAAGCEEGDIISFRVVQS